MGAFQDKVVLISGASRGIGKAIGLKLASEGARIIVTGKTAEPHPKLPGTIHTAAQEMIDAGGDAIAVQMDVRYEESVQAAIDAGIEKWSRLDIVINNASAISLSPAEYTTMKRYDLMQNINTRGTFLQSKLAIPHLKKADNAHILTLSPPLDMRPKWFGPHVAYTIAKYGMSMCMHGLAFELKDEGIAANCLWPKTTIATAAVQNLLGGDQMIAKSRTPQIVADAAAAILTKDSKSFTGQFVIDEDILREEGVTDFKHYAVDSSQSLMPDLFIDPF